MTHSRMNGSLIRLGPNSHLFFQIWFWGEIIFANRCCKMSYSGSLSSHRLCRWPDLSDKLAHQYTLHCSNYRLWDWEYCSLRWPHHWTAWVDPHLISIARLVDEWEMYLFRDYFPNQHRPSLSQKDAKGEVRHLRLTGFLFLWNHSRFKAANFDCTAFQNC